MARIRCNPALWIAVGYAVLGGAWIVGSDAVAETLLPSTVAGLDVQTWKGWFFILATTALLYIASSRALAVRRTAEAETAASEARYRFLADNVSDVLWMTDLSLQPTYVSPSVARQRGFMPEEVTAAPITETLTAESLATLKQTLDRAVGEAANASEGDAPPSPMTLLAEMYRRDGSTMWAELSCQVVCDDAGHPIAVMGVSRDATRRVQIEEERRELTAGLEAVVRSVDELITCADLDGLCRRAVELGREKLGLERCSLFMRDGELMRGTFGTDMHGRTVDERDLCHALDEGSWLRETQVGLGGSRRTWPVGPDGSPGLHPVSGLEIWTATTMISAGGRPVGAFYNDCAISGAPLSEPRQEVLAIFCSLLGRVIERMRAQDELRAAHGELEARVRERTAELSEANRTLEAEIAERGQAEAAYRESEERFRALFEHAPFGAALVAPNGMPLSVNQALVDIMGYPADELCETTFDKLSHPDDAEAGVSRFLELVAGHTDDYRIDRRYIRKDGRVVWVNLAISALRDTTGALRTVIGMAEDITARKLAEAALRESEEQYRTLITNIPDVVWTTDEQRRTAFISPNVSTVYGFGPEDIMHRGEELWFGRIHPEDRPRVEGAFERLLEGRGEYDIEYRIHHADGRWIWLHDRAITTYEHEGIRRADGVFTDITARKQAELAMAETEDRLRTLVAQAPDALLLVAPDGSIVDVNPMACEDLGYQRDELLAMRVPDIDPLYPIERYTELFSEMSDTPIAFPSVHQRKDGTTFPVDIRAVRVTVAGSPRLLAFVRDTTERHATEERIRRAAADLERSNRELEQFAYIASHDLKEPLRHISSGVQLLSLRHGKTLGQDAHRILGDMVHGVTRMGELIDDLLSYSRVGRMAEPHAPVDMDRLASLVITDLAAGIADSDALVTVGDLPIVDGDSAQLHRVLLNLVGNALKFRSDRRPVIGVTADQVDGEWVFSVSDNGVGIEPWEVSRVFEMFHRGAGTEETEGTGMGLAICRKIIESHGGRLWAESTPGQGSAFHFTLG